MRFSRRKLPWRGDAPPYGKVEKELAVKTVTKKSGISAYFKAAKAPTQASSTVEADVAAPVTSTTPDIFPLSPWPNPYATWVSEIMLQQTRVETVIEYVVYFRLFFFPFLSH